jgi:hypothetical protein
VLGIELLTGESLTAQNQNAVARVKQHNEGNGMASEFQTLARHAHDY